MIKHVIFSSLCLFGLNCKADWAPAPTHEEPPSLPGPNEPTLTGMINNERIKRGLPGLITYQHLECASLNHAEDMAIGKFCSHTGSDFSTPWQRSQRCGGRASGEIIACGQEFPEQAIQSWIASRPHATIMFDRANIGIGAARVGNYWVVMFMK
jgi:uncharacterized protein YkwD